jgi:hypothetical protein
MNPTMQMKNFCLVLKGSDEPKVSVLRYKLLFAGQVWLPWRNKQPWKNPTDQWWWNKNSWINPEPWKNAKPWSPHQPKKGFFKS